MFETIKNFFVNNWKKFVVSAIAVILSFFLLKFVLAPFLGLSVVSVVGALLIGWLVWSRVALWELNALAKKVGVNLNL